MSGRLLRAKDPRDYLSVLRDESESRVKPAPSPRRLARPIVRPTLAPDGIDRDLDGLEVLGLSNESCSLCEGNGTVGRYAGGRPCNCVYRAIFRCCLQRFRDCAGSGTGFGTLSWEYCSPSGGGRVYSRKQEEYMADFCLVSQRVLSAKDYRLFRDYFLLGADWDDVADRLLLARGNFFHAVYRIERQLGRAFAEIRPYALYPLDEYFGGTVRKRASSPAGGPPAAVPGGSAVARSRLQALTGSPGEPPIWHNSPKTSEL